MTAVIVAMAATLALFGLQPASTFESSVGYVPYLPFAPVSGPDLVPPTVQAGRTDGTAVVPRVTFTIPLATLDDVRRLDERSEIADILNTARRHLDSQIYLAAYVTADDVPAPHVEAAGVADELVIEVGIYLARRGVEADRISGKGVGINSTIGRAVVVSFDIKPARRDPPLPAPIRWSRAPTNAAPHPSLRVRDLHVRVRDCPYSVLLSSQALLKPSRCASYEKKSVTTDST